MLQSAQQLQFPAGTSAKKTRTPKHRNVESRIFIAIVFLYISCEIQSIAIESLENFYRLLAMQRYLSSEKREKKYGEIVESCSRSVESKTLGTLWKHAH